jgi:hypothetical protein
VVRAIALFVAEAQRCRQSLHTSDARLTLTRARLVPSVFCCRRVGAGKEEGLEIWRVENVRTEADVPHFGVKRWPKEDYGRFYKGDSFSACERSLRLLCSMLLPVAVLPAGACSGGTLTIIYVSLGPAAASRLEHLQGGPGC